MAISLKELKNYVEAVGGTILKEHEDSSEGVAILAFDKYNNMLENKNGYTIYLQENGEMFQLRNGMGDLSDMVPNQGMLMALLLDHNSKTKFGHWEIDIEDNVVSHHVEIPLEDNTLTERQFKRIIKVSENSTAELFKIVHALQSTTQSNDSDGI